MDVTKVRLRIITLTGNAAKSYGDRTITLEAIRNLPSDELIFNVADTGFGMTGEQVGCLFQHSS